VTALSWPGVLGPLLAGADLPVGAVRWAMGEVLAGEATPAQIAGFAIALRAKGETAAELGALVDAMLAVATPLPLTPGPCLAAGATLVDTCGTGGDRSGTVNLSTMAALVVAGAGAVVVKHGGRGATSQTGSADLVEALGIPLTLHPRAVARCVADAGIGFCFAPAFHPAMRHAAPARRELGVPTFFNIIGPLANPARPQAQLVGVADARLAALVAGVLAARGTSALVVHGGDGLDELTLSGPTRVWEVRDGLVTEASVQPGDVGLGTAPVAALVGGDATHNAGVTRDLLAGRLGGPVRDAVLLNAAAALVAARPGGSALLPRLRDGLASARAALADGAAQDALERWVTVAQA